MNIGVQTAAFLLTRNFGTGFIWSCGSVLLFAKEVGPQTRQATKRAGSAGIPARKRANAKAQSAILGRILKNAAQVFMSATALFQALHRLLAVVLVVHGGLFPRLHRHAVLLGKLLVLLFVLGRALKGLSAATRLQAANVLLAFAVFVRILKVAVDEGIDGQVLVA